MAKLRLGYDLLNGPLFLGNADSELPSSVAPDAKVLNVGSASYPIIMASSGYVINSRAKTTTAHTSGDARNTYLKLDLYGSAGGDCLRAYTAVNANLDTARGAHISLSFVATAGGSECSGTGTALTCTTHIPNVASWAPTGTLYGAQIQLYSDGTNSDPAGLTTLAGLAIGNDGDTTGAADVDDDAFLLHLTGWTAGAAHMFATGLTPATVTGACSASLRIKVGSTTYYIPLATAIA